MSPQPPDSPLLCAPGEKKDLELRNQATVIAYIADFFQRSQGRSPYTTGVLLEMHALTIKDIYPCGGEFRTATSKVRISGASITPVDPFLLPGAIADLLSESGQWRTSCTTLTEQIQFVARCFHRFMAIHPFMGGNGRVGRGFLLMMLHDMGIFCPSDLLLTYIQERRVGYLEALRAADTENFAPLGRYIEIGIAESRRLLLRQGVLLTSLGPYILRRLNQRERQLLERPAWAFPMSLSQYQREEVRLLKRLGKIVVPLLDRAESSGRN